MSAITKLIALIFLFNFWIGNSQDTLLVHSFKKNKYAFEFLPSDGFVGEGWDTIASQAGTAKTTVVGEIHGINEIPILIRALSEQIEYDTFVIETDPFLADIMTKKIKNLSPQELKEWRLTNLGILSFYSYMGDFQLLQKLIGDDIEVIGIDQITALNDIPIYSYLAESTTDPEKKEIFLAMARNAKLLFTKLLKDPQKVRPYLMSDLFPSDLERLTKTTLSAQESEIIQKLQMSRNIYFSRNGHEKRIMLMKNQLMKEYESSLVDKKVLMRLGANHSLKGKSFLDVYDIGNLAHNLAESEFEKSFHLAVFSETGEAGNPFLRHPDTPIKLPKELNFLNDLSGEDWSYFDLKAVRQNLRQQKVQVEIPFLKRLIEGYDGLVIVPRSTPARME